MKKNLSNKLLTWCRRRGDLRPFLFTLIISLLAVINLQASTYSQNTELSLDLENVSLIDVFKEIEANSEFRFMYESGQIDLQKKVSIHVKKFKIDPILQILFDDTNITYKTVNRQIIITTLEETKNDITKNIFKV